MAIHIKDIDKMIEIIRDTKKVIEKLQILDRLFSKMTPVGDLHKLSLDIDEVLDSLDE